MPITDANYADHSFLFTLHSGERENRLFLAFNAQFLRSN